MSTGTRYALAKDVIHETFEGEVIIANLQGGSYYTLDGTGADIWAGLVAGVSLGDITAAVVAAGALDGDAAAEVEEVVERLAAQLAAESLIHVVDDAAPLDARPLEVTRFAVATTTFTVPTLERYDDMQQLLLLDPIPEVDDTGWPSAPGFG